MEAEEEDRSVKREEMSMNEADEQEWTLNEDDDAALEDILPDNLVEESDLGAGQVDKKEGQDEDEEDKKQQMAPVVVPESQIKGKSSHSKLILHLFGFIS